MSLSLRDVSSCAKNVALCSIWLSSACSCTQQHQRHAAGGGGTAQTTRVATHLDSDVARADERVAAARRPAPSGPLQLRDDSLLHSNGALMQPQCARWGSVGRRRTSASARHTRLSHLRGLELVAQLQDGLAVVARSLRRRHSGTAGVDTPQQRAAAEAQQLQVEGASARTCFSAPSTRDSAVLSSATCALSCMLPLRSLTYLEHTRCSRRCSTSTSRTATPPRTLLTTSCCHTRRHETTRDDTVIARE
jgi:hypothetical protein